mgnify:CR=1 FL=1
MKGTTKTNKSLPNINERIKVEQLQLIDHNGQNLGIISRAAALAIADEAGLDLVLISDTGSEGVPVAKIMDFGRLQYDKKKKSTDAKKKQKQIKIKEIKLRPKIGLHDFETKLKQGVEFLNEGKRLKVTAMFRGRENAIKDELGKELFERVHLVLVDRFGESNLISEADSKAGSFWSKVYYIKGK